MIYFVKMFILMFFMVLIIVVVVFVYIVIIYLGWRGNNFIINKIFLYGM